jgi:hypothetical protein
MNFQDWLPLVGMGAMVLIFWKQGGNNASSQVIATYKEQVGQLQAQVAELTRRVGELTGVMAEKDKQIQSLQQVSIDNNPVLEKYMADTSNYLHEIKNILTVTSVNDQRARRKIKSSK